MGNNGSVHRTVTLNWRICHDSWRKGTAWMLYAGVSVRVATKGREVREGKKKFAFSKGAILGTVLAPFPVSCPGCVAVSLISFFLYNF